jgi:hypothetical protein
LRGGRTAFAYADLASVRLRSRIQQFDSRGQTNRTSSPASRRQFPQRFAPCVFRHHPSPPLLSNYDRFASTFPDTVLRRYGGGMEQQAVFGENFRNDIWEKSDPIQAFHIMPPERGVKWRKRKRAVIARMESRAWSWTCVTPCHYFRMEVLLGGVLSRTGKMRDAPVALGKFRHAVPAVHRRAAQRSARIRTDRRESRNRREVASHIHLIGQISFWGRLSLTRAAAHRSVDRIVIPRSRFAF